MKSILMSIKPKWVEKIASGEKTVDVRKTVPKCGTPFKVYIYCTYGRPLLMRSFYDGKSLFKFSGVSNKDAKVIYDEELWNGRVVGEFVCDCITDFWADNTGFEAEGRDPFYMPCGYAKKATCLTNKQFVEYGKGAPLYGLHISDLKIYDKPKRLREFCNGCNDSCDPMYGSYCIYCDKKNELKTAPQSWCYVEDL